MLDKLLHINGYMVSYVSPVTLLMALGLITMFDGIKINKGQKIILFLSTMSFDVYLIHSHIMVYDHFIANAFAFIGKLNVFLIPFIVLLACFTIYLMSSVVGYIRCVLYKATRFDKLIARISSKYDLICNKIIADESEDILANSAK